VLDDGDKDERSVFPLFDRLAKSWLEDMVEEEGGGGVKGKGVKDGVRYGDEGDGRYEVNLWTSLMALFPLGAWYFFTSCLLVRVVVVGAIERSDIGVFSRS
jgi:hypothetical protein